jgi:hypothetical protein
VRSLGERDEEHARNDHKSYSSLPRRPRRHTLMTDETDVKNVDSFRKE